MELNSISFKQEIFGNSQKIKDNLLELLELNGAKDLIVKTNEIKFSGPSSIKALITHPLVGIKEGSVKVKNDSLLIQLSIPDLLKGFYAALAIMMAVLIMFLNIDAKRIGEYVFFFLFECFILSGYFFNRWFMYHKFKKMVNKAIEVK